MNIELNLIMDDPAVLQSIGRMLGLLEDELTETHVSEYLQKKLQEHLRDIATRERMSQMSLKEVTRRVYERIANGSRSVGVPLQGATDSELCRDLALPTSKVRWSRFRLLKDGYIREGGLRGKTKFWIVTDKAPKKEWEMFEIPEGIANERLAFVDSNTGCGQGESTEVVGPDEGSKLRWCN